MIENDHKKEKEKEEEVSLDDDFEFKLPHADLSLPSSGETIMIYTINGESFYMFMKNTWIGDSGASCHINKNDTRINYITDFDKLVQCRTG